MSPVAPLLLVLAFGLFGWLAARARARGFTRAPGGIRAHSLPGYHAWYVALWTVLPALVFALVWASVSPGLALHQVLADPAAANLPAFGFQRDRILAEAQAVATGHASGVFNPAAKALVEPFRTALGRFGVIGALVTLLLAAAGGGVAFTRVKAGFTARSSVERGVMVLLAATSLVAIFTTFGIFFSLLFETIRFFQLVNPADFLLGSHWQPDPMAPVATVTGDNYGAVPLFWATIFIGAVIAMIVAIPVGLMSAVFLTQYASPGLRKVMKPLLEILAGVPTVVYGYFAALIVAPAVRDFGQSIGIASASSESALAAGLVMGIMIIPFVSSMADDAIAAVPQALRDGSLAMGATTAETIRKVLIPAALPGIVAGIMLAVSRAIGETMIVVMAAGAAARLSANPFESMTTVTYQIVQLLTGDQEFDSPKTLSAFALGLVLFVVTLILNIVALRVVKRFREAYE